MNQQEHSAKTPARTTGRFAVAFAPLRAKGSGASSFRLLAGLALALTAVLALTVAPASALTTRQFQSQITGAGNPPAPFGEPAGLTTDSLGRLWASDRGRHSVDRFSAAGAYEAQNDGSGAWAESTEVRGLAFSAALDEVFAADSANEGHLFGLDPATAAFSGKDLALGLGGSIQVAADNSAGPTGGDLYVSNGSTVIRIRASDGSADPFSGSAAYISGNEISGPFSEINALAVAPDGSFYVGGAFEGNPLVGHFAPSGEQLGEITEAAPGQSVLALAVDPTNEDLIVAKNDAAIREFDSSDALLRALRRPGPEGSEFLGVRGIAVGPSGTTYISEAAAEPERIDVFGPLVTLPDVTTGPADVHSVSSATLHGEVDPAGLPVTECFFEYGPTTAYGQTVACDPAAAALGEGEGFEPVAAELENLSPGTTYHYRLVAANAEGTNRESQDREFFTGASIDSTSASAVSATAATLETEVNPHGLPTTYRFQYGITTAYGSETPMPPAPLGSGEADVARAAFISGLEPSTTYHFRVIAENSLGRTDGPDRTFTTQPAAGSSLLPDGRGWELVSPPDKQGATLEPISLEGGLIQAAADGSAITYFANGSIVSEPAGDRSADDSQDLSIRAASGWSTADITTPHQHPAGIHPGLLGEYKLFSSDLSLGAVEPNGATPLSPYATERTPYLRLPDGSYRPLVVGCPEPPAECPAEVAAHANVPAGTKFGGVEISPEEFVPRIGFITGTPDLSHLLLESEGSTALVEGFDTEGGIYEWSAGALTPVSFLPSGDAALCGGAAPACVPTTAFVGASSFAVRNAISNDGSRVFLTTNAGHLYLRDLPRGETLRLDAAQGVAEPEFAGATFQIASEDGSRVFFTDTQRLTADSTADSTGAVPRPDLYLCEVEITEGHLACALSDLTVNTLDSTEPARVLDAVIGVPADGSAVYFVADGRLTAEPAANGEEAVVGDCANSGEQSASNRCNLYRYDFATQTTSLVAVLSGADYHDWSAGGGARTLNELTGRVSPDGRWLAFMSERPLTGYDNRDVATGERDEEVFLYDAAAGAGAGRLLCASCNPTGARPQGRRGPHGIPAALVDAPLLWQDRWYAASIPGWTSTTLSHALHQSRYLSDSGRLFFNAADALVPQDTNGTEDVYQYEPPGVGSCSEGSPGFAPRNGGCVSLISSGTSATESAFMDASESGNDVFFLTGSRLTAKDEDKALDLYDARVGGGEAAPVKPVECAGDACQQPAVPPNHPTPGTLLINGPGNVKQCPKGKKLHKGKCVKKHKAKEKHHNKKSPKKHQKSKRTAGHNGGGGK